VADLTAQLRQKEESSKKDSRIRDSVHAHRKAEEKIEDLQKQLESSARTNQALLDEHQALQMVFNAHETKLRETEQENDRLIGPFQL